MQIRHGRNLRARLYILPTLYAKTSPGNLRSSFLLYRSSAEDIVLRKKLDATRWGMELGINKAFRRDKNFIRSQRSLIMLATTYCNHAPRETFTLAMRISFHSTLNRSIHFLGELG